MKIEFRLDWVDSHRVARRDFKQVACYSLFFEYVERIKRFSPCEMFGALKGESPGGVRAKTWVCEKGKNALPLTSEEVAGHLGKLLNAGTQCLRIVIGGADGIPEKKVQGWQPDLLWSFGPLTLPHELAPVITSEQIYRAWTILRGMPYHLGH